MAPTKKQAVDKKKIKQTILIGIVPKYNVCDNKWLCVSWNCSAVFKWPSAVDVSPDLCRGGLAFMSFVLYANFNQHILPFPQDKRFLLENQPRARHWHLLRNYD